MTACFEISELGEHLKSGITWEKCDPAFAGFIKTILKMDLT